MTGKVTSLDVAERAGVSRSAVSRVFTPGASVSKKTAEKVRAAAEELGYRPNILARSLLTGRSRMIGLVVAYLDNHFYPKALEQLSTALEAQGYHVLIFMASQSAGNIERVTEEILDYQVDGLVLASVTLSSDLANRCRALGVPVVLFNRRQGEPGELAIVSDNRAGGRLAAEHLLACGCRRIAHIAGQKAASTQADREAGFLEGLVAAGVRPFARAIGNFDLTQARAATLELFGRDDRPDSVFVANDYMAFAVLDTLREIGLDIPGDVAVIGFDDVPAAAWPTYDLTTIRQDSAAMVAATVETLMAAIKGNAEPRDELPVRLVIRSTA